MNTDKENTWRALQGLKPIQSLRCRLGWHRWSNFEIVSINSMDGFGNREYAVCHCVDCGLPRRERPVTLLDKTQ